VESLNICRRFRSLVALLVRYPTFYCVSRCPIHLSLRCCAVSKMFLHSWSLCSTSTFLTLSTQQILFILMPERSCTVYTSSEADYRTGFCHNVFLNWPTFKSFNWLDVQKICNTVLIVKDLAQNVSVHYLAKYNCSKISMLCTLCAGEW